ncbi:MAG: hypothetical protein HKN18_05950 [Silicimonas sp.]|nr:hypothetical protein [Silicimonas sp.]
MNVTTVGSSLPKYRNLNQKTFSIDRKRDAILITQQSFQLDLVEKLVCFLGLSLVLLSALMVLPVILGLVMSDGLLQSEGLLREFLATLTILVSGASLLYFGWRGFRRHIQLDRKSGTLKVGFLGVDRKFRAALTVPFSSIDSAFLQRNKGNAQPARLALRLRGRAGSVIVFSATEKALTPILDEVVSAVRAASEHHAPRRRTTRQLVHVAFS